MPYAFQQQVVEAEREVERRSAVTGRFGIEEHWAFRAVQDVLGTDIIMHQRHVCFGNGVRHFADSRCGIGVLLCGVEEVWFEPEREELLSVGKLCADGGISGGRGMNARERASHRGGKARIGFASRKL